MPVSSGLEKYFDKSRKKKRKKNGDSEIKEKLTAVESQIDPAFSMSFQSFKERILEIVDETPEATDMVDSELWNLNEKLKSTKRRHNLKKAAAIIDAVA